jgi:predicted branched-subunit amino acid permease
MNLSEYKTGVKRGIPVGVGYFSVSFGFGAMAAAQGVRALDATLISLTNLTSAGQVAGAGILAAGGGMVELAMTTIIINMRYFLMSLSVSQKVETDMSLPKRMGISFGITDEVFAVSMQHKGAISASYMAGLILTPVLGWTGGTLTGAVATSFMPQTLSNAMGIAMYGMFIAIITPPARKDKAVLFTVGLAIAASFAFSYLPVLNLLSGGWAIIVITIIASAVAAWKFPIEVEEEV